MKILCSLLLLAAAALSGCARLARGRNADVEDTAATMQAAATTVQAIELARSGDNDRARDVLNQAAELADSEATRTPSAQQRTNARKMRDLSNALPSPAPMVALPAGAKPRLSPPKGPMPSAVRVAHDEAMQRLQ